MEKIDIRKLSDQERALLRRQVIGLRKQRKGNKEVAELLGLSSETTSRWWQRYQREGKAMLAEPKRGRKQGEKRTLNPEQEKQIQKMIVDHCPDQLKLPFTLWDRQAVNLLILQQFGINKPIRSVKDVSHKVILILDNLKVHHCKPVKKWLGKNTDKIEVFYLPSYSPKLNPDEYLNNDLKQAAHDKLWGNYPIKSSDSSEDDVAYEVFAEEPSKS